MLVGCSPRVGPGARSAARQTSGSMNRTASINVAQSLPGAVSQIRPPATQPASDTSPMSFDDLPPLPTPDQLTTSPPQEGGIVVFEPVAGADVATPDADFAAGCGYYLNFAVGGQPMLGQTPLTFSITRNKREQSALSGLRLSLADAVAFAKAVGATETAVGTIERLPSNTSSGANDGGLALTYRLVDANTARPIGEPIIVRWNLSRDSGGSAGCRIAARASGRRPPSVADGPARCYARTSRRRSSDAPGRAPDTKRPRTGNRRCAARPDRPALYP